MAIHSPYTSDMRKLKGTFPLFALLLTAAIPCFSQSAPSSQQQVQEHTRKAQEYLRENRPDLAVPEFKAIVALEPNNVDARGNLGVLLFFQGAYADAIPQLRAALKMQPSLWKIQALLGMAEKRTGDIHAATGDLEKAFPKLKEQKIRIDAGMELIDIYSKTGEMDKAAATVSVVRELDPTNVEVLYTAYRLYSDLADEARLSLIVVGPNSARTHQMMAHELARQGNNAEAIANYREALKLEPNLPGLHFELAEMLNSSATPDAPQQAELEYKAALALNPFDEKSECRLGDLAAAKGDTAGSHEHYERALKLDPNDPEANIGLAKALMAMNQPEKALPLLEKAVKLDPTSAVAHFRLATIYRKMGRTEDAKHEIAEYQKYKDMKEKLRDVYRQMRLEPDKKVHEDEDARQQ
ncbi:MAG TPA: tetratricopeptide repeat protein [Candidatus Acidoferrum sp.]|nr:tetratricopeptide repeat protein [Candidatus Acidoferrum sp.]